MTRVDRRTRHARLAVPLLALAVIGALGSLPTPSHAQTWTVTVTLLEATSLSDDDASGPDDIYWKASIIPTLGSGSPSFCDFFGSHVDDQNHITPNWTCVATVSGGAATTVQIVLELWEHDTTSADDHFDTHPSPGPQDLDITFRPPTFQMTMNVPGWGTPRCAVGPIRMSGFHGDDRAEVVFTVSASIVGAPNGDSDGDGLLDAWEFCGLDANADGVVDVDLPALGARPNRKDLFVELDWMVNNTGVAATQHSHEPWLPALITAWNELNTAPVTNPPMPGFPTRSGIAAHLDVGTLYANYAMDFDGNGSVDFSVGSDGNLDLDSDGIPDIGNLGALGTGTLGGGNQLAEDPALAPVPGSSPADFFNAGSDFFAIKGANFNPIRNLVFHYAVFGHQWGNPPGTSSGLAEPCGLPACNDFTVTLGGWPRQRVDADRNGVPDLAGALLRSPSGLPVDGTVAQHAGTFLHELGHNLALGHGGGDGTNNKPNYLSIMNYNWQVTGLAFDFTGDLLADPVALDLDRDGLIDARRFLFSGPPPLPTLNEFSLNESAGIGDANTLTRYSCPPPPLGPGGNRVGRGTGSINWNCNGNPNEPAVTADINQADGSGLSPALTGFDDYARIAGGGLVFQPGAPGITLEQYREMERTTTRITPLPSAERVRERCLAPRTIRFDDLRPDTKVTTQYAPLATFLQDALRTPVTVDSAGRGGAPTASPENSLMNRPTGGQAAPLVVTLDPPQRAVALSLGRTLTGQPTDALAARAALQAFDTNDLSMGDVTVALPAASSGVTTALTAAAIFPDQLISRIEVRYEAPFQTGPTTIWVPTAEPQQIDDLVLCDRLDTSDVTATFPPPPKFGDLPVTLRIESVLLVPGGPADGEAGHTTITEQPVTGVPVTVEGTAGTTSLVLTRPEGHALTVTAPPGLGATTKFLHWRLDKTIQFGEGLQSISFTLLRPGTLTAVFVRRKDERQPPDRERPCECLERCCRDSHDDGRTDRRPAHRTPR
jgi:hypothetical protein